MFSAPLILGFFFFPRLDVEIRELGSDINILLLDIIVSVYLD